MYIITFIFDRCHRNRTAAIPNKCERDLKLLDCIFAESKFPVMEKWTNEALVTTIPEPYWQALHSEATSKFNYSF